MTKDKILSHKEMFEFLTDSYYSEEEVSLKLKKEIENTLFKESPKYSYLYIVFLLKYTYNDFISYSKAVESISFNPDLSYDYLELLLEHNIYLPDKYLKQLVNCIVNSPFSTNNYKSYISLLIKMLNNESTSEDFIRCFTFIYYNFIYDKDEVFEYILINKINISKKIFKILEGDRQYFSCFINNISDNKFSKKYINFFNLLKNKL